MKNNYISVKNFSFCLASLLCQFVLDKLLQRSIWAYDFPVNAWRYPSSMHGYMFFYACIYLPLWRLHCKHIYSVLDIAFSNFFQHFIGLILKLVCFYFWNKEEIKSEKYAYYTLLMFYYNDLDYNDLDAITFNQLIRI